MVENLPAILLGFPLEALAGFAMFRGLWAIYIHSNVSLTPGPLRYILGAPRLHHWHHEMAHSGRVNFANLSPLMDLMFGTYFDPGHMPKNYGIPEDISHNYLVQMVDPVLPREMRKRLQRRLRAERQRGASPTGSVPASSVVGSAQARLTAAPR